MTNYLTKIGVTLALAAFALTPVVRAADEKKAPAASGSLEEQMTGYWAPDPEEMMKIIKKEIGDDPNAQAMLPMVTAMLATMAFEVKKGEVNVHGMGEVKKSTYKITKTDAATKTLTMTVKEDGEGAEEEEGTATIEGDRLTLAKAEEKIVLNRIDAAEFAKRKASAPVVPGGPVIPE